MKLAVLGYGNLGKAVEKYAIDNKIELVGIFSRRKVTSKQGTPVYELENFSKYDADVAALCFGSASDMLGLAPLFALQCNTVDAFDNHSEMKYYRGIMNEAAKKTNHIALLGCGWDTGVFSAIRGLNTLIGDTQGTFWGKGVSQGHTNAIKSIDGVIDAVQFTLPVETMKNREAILNLPSTRLHKRLCYVVAQDHDRRRISDEILSMKGYFLGYETQINFVTQKELDELKNDTRHKGEILCFGNGAKSEYKLQMEDNCMLTAKIMVEYCPAITSLIGKKSYGAYTAMDIAPSEFLGESTWKFL